MPLADALVDRIAEWDRFNLLMIEQPLWYDDFYFHSMLQKRLDSSVNRLACSTTTFSWRDSCSRQ